MENKDEKEGMEAGRSVDTGEETVEPFWKICLCRGRR